MPVFGLLEVLELLIQLFFEQLRLFHAWVVVVVIPLFGLFGLVSVARGCSAPFLVSPELLVLTVDPTELLKNLLFFIVEFDGFAELEDAEGILEVQDVSLERLGAVLGDFLNQIRQFFLTFVFHSFEAVFGGADQKLPQSLLRARLDVLEVAFLQQSGEFELEGLIGELGGHDPPADHIGHRSDVFGDRVEVGAVVAGFGLFLVEVVAF